MSFVHFGVSSIIDFGIVAMTYFTSNGLAKTDAKWFHVWLIFCLIFHELCRCCVHFFSGWILGYFNSHCLIDFVNFWNFCASDWIFFKNFELTYLFITWHGHDFWPVSWIFGVFFECLSGFEILDFSATLIVMDDSVLDFCEISVILAQNWWFFVVFDRSEIFSSIINFFQSGLGYFTSHLGEIFDSKWFSVLSRFWNFGLVLDRFWAVLRFWIFQLL